MSNTSSSSQYDRITLRAMRFQVRIGVLPHEAVFPQPIEIDLAVDVRPHAGGMMVDYAVLYDAVAAVVHVPHVTYLETVAEQVAAAALAIRGVCVAHVAVRKPHVPLPGPLAYAEVAITRTAMTRNVPPRERVANPGDPDDRVATRHDT